MADDLFSIEGKTALVTGGSRGIGLMIARGFAEAGARLYISSRKAEACEEAAAELRALGAECTPVAADLSRVDECRRVAGEVAAREERLHILVNNAGAAWGEPVDTFPEHGFDKVYDLNVKGVFFLTQSLLPLLRKAATPEDPARIVNIGSIDGLRVPALLNYSYSASKAALHMLTRHLGRALAPDHVTVNAIAPGLFPSKMTKFLFEHPDGVEAVVGHIPLARHGRQDDIAGTARFLCSRAGSFLTGAVIPVDGGVSTL